MTRVMSAEEKALREERARVFDGMVAIRDKMRDEKRSAFTVEERADFDARSARLDALEGDIDRIEKLNKREAGKEELAETRGVTRDESDSREDAYAKAFGTWMRGGMDALNPEQRTMFAESRAVLDGSALQTSPSAQGGYLIPQGFWHNLQIAMKAYGGLLEHANIIRTATGNPLPWPTIDPTGIVGSYITEANQLGFTDFTFGQGLMNAWTITSGIILASLQLINDAAFDVDTFVNDRMGEAIGRKIAQELQTGTGTNALLGIQTALAARGVVAGQAGGVFQGPSGTVNLLGQSSAVQKASHGATAVVGFDDLQNMIAKIDPAYRAAGACSWVVSDATLTQLRLVTDSFGHPLWQPNVQVGTPSQLLDYPYVVDQNVGSLGTVATSGLVLGGLLFGDFKRAMVVRQVDQASTMRLTERYADYLQVGYLGFVRMDARSNDLRAAVAYAPANA